jgi:hypothetical protein
MSARENLLRKSCRAPADNHFIDVSHRQHSCGKKDLYQRFFTTDENVTLSANTRLHQFLADRQSAVLKRAKEVLGGWQTANNREPQELADGLRSHPNQFQSEQQDQQIADDCRPPATTIDFLSIISQ